jgi:hypothetical protein
MSIGQGPCHACSFYKTIGGKGFCFKKNKVIKTPPFNCENFQSKADAELKKRLILEEKDERSGQRNHEKFKVDEKSLVSEDFRLPKIAKTRERAFIDYTGEDEEKRNSGEMSRDLSQNLFMGIILGGFIILIIVLFATGVV